MATVLVLACASAAVGREWKFETQELPLKLTVGYGVQAVDVNRDGKQDLAIVDSKRIVWLENPSWKVHTVMSTPAKTDNVCLAAHDINGDGRVDFAVGADWTLNTKAGGTIQWLPQAADAGKLWDLHPIGEEPTVHRMRFVDLDHDGKSELVVAPLLGRDSTRPNFAESGVRLLSYAIPADPVRGPWKSETICDNLHVMHNFVPTDLDRDGKTDLLVVSFEGVTLLRRKDGKWSQQLIGEGNQRTSPNRGASEIKHGKRTGDADYIATIEPWHGHQVVVYTPPPRATPAAAAEKRWTRHVVDENLLWGHAVACADLDGDADQELIIGVRDKKSDEHQCGVRIYDPTADEPTKWPTFRLDPGGVAVEDLTVADLNADGHPDIIAVGRHTHNIRIYWNRTK